MRNHELELRERLHAKLLSDLIRRVYKQGKVKLVLEPDGNLIEQGRYSFLVCHVKNKRSIDDEASFHNSSRTKMQGCNQER